MPTPEDLSKTAHAVLAVTLFTAGLWLFQVMNNGVASVLMMGLLVADRFPERTLFQEPASSLGVATRAGLNLDQFERIGRKLRGMWSMGAASSRLRDFTKELASPGSGKVTAMRVVRPPLTGWPISLGGPRPHTLNRSLIDRNR